MNHLNSRYVMSFFLTRPKRISFFTPPDSLTVLEISGHILSPSSVIAWTRYLAWHSSGDDWKMKGAGLISSRRDGPDHVYFLNAGRFRDLARFLEGLIKA